jgi:hypothetical protein
MARITSIILMSFCCKFVFAQVFFDTNFEANPVGTAYIRTLWQSDGFQTATWDNGLASRTYIDNSTSVSGTNSLRVTYPAGEFGPNGTGCQIPLQFTPQDEVYMSYRLIFSDNFSWGTTSEGGKLPGFAGGARCSGCSNCDGTNGFSARLMWRTGGRAVLYLYHMDKANNCGDDIQLAYPWGDNVVFEKGEWYHIMQRVKINTNGSSSAYDGEVEIWVNGHQVLSISGYRFTANGDKVDNLYFSTFHGGASAAWAPTETCYTWFDDVKISANPADVAMQSCKGPDLGPNTSLCGVSSVTLQANVPETNATFQWVKDNLTQGTNSNLTVSSPGTYVLIYDSLGCVRRDTILVSSVLRPNLGSDREICATSFETLDAQEQGTAYSYEWTKDGTVITGAAAQTYNAYQPGKYRVSISASGCASAFDEITLTSGFLTVPNVGGAPNSEVTLTVQDEGGSYAWYNSADAQTALFTGKSYTATVGAESRFVYVEDAGGFTGLIGKRNAGTTFTDNRYERRMRFEVFRKLSVDSITVYAVDQQDITIRILAADETTVIHSISYTNVLAGENRIYIGASLEAGHYFMDAMGSTGRLLLSNENDTGISFPYTIDGMLSIKGSNENWIDLKPYYLYFYNWRVSTGNSCARTPVFIEADISPALPITQTITLQTGWNLMSVYVSGTANGKGSINSAAAIFQNVDVEMVKNMDGFWKANQPEQLNSLQTIEPGNGYLVYMNTAGTIEITGMPVETQHASSLRNGWNMIGYPGCTDAIHCVSIPISDYFEASDSEIIKNFEGFWEPDSPLNSIQNFEPGKAYFLKK